MPSPFKVVTRNHSHSIRIRRSKVAVTRSTAVDDLAFESDLKVTKGEFVLSKSKIEESMELELHVVVLVSST